MTNIKRQVMLVGVMLAMLTVATAWSVQVMLADRAAANGAAADLAECRQLATSIEALRHKPRIAAAEDIGAVMLGQRITTASQQAQLPQQALDGIFPQSARRMGNSPYAQKPTTLVLRDVTLAQLVKFLYHLTEGESGLTVRDLRLRAPRGETAGAEQWDAEATITCLIYQPPATGH